MLYIYSLYNHHGSEVTDAGLFLLWCIPGVLFSFITNLFEHCGKNNGSSGSKAGALRNSAVRDTAGLQSGITQPSHLDPSGAQQVYVLSSSPQNIFPRKHPF